MSDLLSGYVFKPGEKGLTDIKFNGQFSAAKIQPDFYLSRPQSTAMDPTDQFLIVKGDGSFARIVGSDISASVTGSLVLANTSQSGMMQKLSGTATDFMGGDNAFHPMPIANNTKTGDLNILSGNAGDYVGGDNGCHGLIAAGDARWMIRTGDTISWPTGSKLTIATTNGLGPSSYSTAPLLISVGAGLSGSRPGIGFNNSTQGVGSYLYYDSDNKFHYVDTAGTVHTTFEDKQSNTQAAGTTLLINGTLSVAGQQIVPGALYVQNGGQATFQAGSALTIQANSSLYVDGALILRSGISYIQNGVQLMIQNGGQIVAQGPSPGLIVQSETGLAASSYSSAVLRLYTTGGSQRPGIGFWHAGLGYACFLYYESNGKLRFIDSGGVVHEITSS